MRAPLSMAGETEVRCGTGSEYPPASWALAAAWAWRGLGWTSAFRTCVGMNYMSDSPPDTRLRSFRHLCLDPFSALVEPSGDRRGVRVWGEERRGSRSQSLSCHSFRSSEGTGQGSREANRLCVWGLRSSKATDSGSEVGAGSPRSWGHHGN